MIVKNEEKFLRGCLDSVKDIAGQLVIVDTGSSDSTLQIAEEYSAEIHHFNWVNDFSAARNFALSKSTGEWILYLDADERLSPDSINEIKQITNRSDKIGVNCFVKSPDDESNRENVIYYPRLFRNDNKLKFTGSVHEQIISSLAENGYKIVDSTIEILHLGYNVSKDKKKEKAERNLRLLLNDQEKNPSFYTLFQLAQTYNVLEKFDESTKLFREVIQNKKAGKEFLLIGYYYIAVDELRNHNVEAALKTTIEGLKVDENYPPLNYLLSKLCLRNGDLKQSIKLITKAYRVNSSILRTKKFNGNDIILNNEELILFGLNVSRQAGSKESIKFFLDEFSGSEAKNFIVNGNEKSKNFRKLLDKTPVSEKEISIITSIASPGNIEYLISIISSYNILQTKCILLENLKNKFPDDCSALTAYAIAILEEGRTDESLLLLEKLLSHKDVQPSVPFYLISIYINLGRIDEISRLVEYSENKFSTIPEAKAAINMIKQKISGLLQAV